MKKIKCKVCGARFMPEARQRYTAAVNKGALESLVSVPSMYDAFDCPQCGCQVTCGERLPQRGRAKDGE